MNFGEKEHGSKVRPTFFSLEKFIAMHECHHNFKCNVFKIDLRLEAKESRWFGYFANVPEDRRSMEFAKGC